MPSEISSPAPTGVQSQKRSGTLQDYPCSASAEGVFEEQQRTWAVVVKGASEASRRDSHHIQAVFDETASLAQRRFQTRSVQTSSSRRGARCDRSQLGCIPDRCCSLRALTLKGHENTGKNFQRRAAFSRSDCISTHTTTCVWFINTSGVSIHHSIVQLDISKINLFKRRSMAVFKKTLVF